MRAHRRMGWMLAAWAVLLGVGGCRDIGAPEALQEAGVGVVSDPTPGPSAAGRAGLSGAGAAAAVEVAYVSLQPGTVPDGERATLHNPRNGVILTVGMEEGGFDPVPIEATAGDTVEIEVRVSSSSTPVQLSYEVPVRRRPIVVRTNPTPRKRDVPLNAAIVIVFSEPVDPATLTGGAVSVRRGSQVAPGRLEFRDPAHLIAAFVPTAPLAPDTDHELVITQDLKDQDGDPLEATIVVEFTTTDLAGRIVFTRASSGPGNSTGLARAAIYWMDADGYGPTRLTSGETYDLAPAWSPDGRKIAFLRWDSAFASTGIYVMNADGSGVTRLSPDSAQHGEPAWSPDGRKIAFSAIGPSRDPEWFASHVYVMNADGSGVTQLTADSASDVSPTWSPDGRKIAVSRSPPGLFAGGIYIMNADGSGITSVTAGSASASDWEPAWSPDGTRIAFTRMRRGQIPGDIQSDIYVMNVDGSQARRLSTSAGHDQSPAWSPDGTKIAFTAQFTGGSEIYVINADGSRERRVTVGGFDNLNPAWTR